MVGGQRVCVCVCERERERNALCQTNCSFEILVVKY